MKCAMCKGDMKEGIINYPVDRENQFLLIKNVPALICQQCGESYLDDEVFAKIEEIVENIKGSNVEIEIIKFAA